MRNRVGGTAERVNLSATGAQPVGGHACVPSISADGRFVSFITAASNLPGAGVGKRHCLRERALDCPRARPLRGTAPCVRTRSGARVLP